jgi:hypothetical protein
MLSVGAASELIAGLTIRAAAGRQSNLAMLCICVCVLPRNLSLAV